MKKVTFIRATQTKFGGAENFFSRLCNEIKRQGTSIDTLHSSLPKWLPSWVRAWLFNYFVRAKKGNQFYFAMDRVDSADIYRAGDGVHKAFMKTRHKSANPLHWTYCTLEKRCFDRAKRIIAISEVVKQDLINEYQVDETKIRVIYNGITMPSLDRKTARDNIEEEFPEAKSKPIIMMAGTGFDRKGAPAFLSELQKLKIDFHAFIVGKDKNLEHYKAMAQRMGLAEKVTFTGLRSDIDQFYQAANLFLFLPSYEPFGNVVLEALSYGAPTFSHRPCGGSEILPKAWRVDEIENPTTAIEALLTNEEAWAAASQQALNIARAHPIEKTTYETLAIIEEVMNEH